MEVVVVEQRPLAEALGEPQALEIEGISRVIREFDGRVQLAHPWDGQGARPLTFDAYCRISKDERGQLEGVARQLRDILEYVVRQQLPLGQVWIDNSLSAWSLKAASKRVGWQRLMQRIEDQAVDGVVIFYLDRMLRQPRDVEALIQAADRNDGLMVRGTSGSYDLAVPRAAPLRARPRPGHAASPTSSPCGSGPARRTTGWPGSPAVGACCSGSSASVPR